MVKHQSNLLAVLNLIDINILMHNIDIGFMSFVCLCLLVLCQNDSTAARIVKVFKPLIE